MECGGELSLRWRGEVRDGFQISDVSYGVRAMGFAFSKLAAMDYKGWVVLKRVQGLAGE